MLNASSTLAQASQSRTYSHVRLQPCFCPKRLGLPPSNDPRSNTSRVRDRYKNALSLFAPQSGTVPAAPEILPGFFDRGICLWYILQYGDTIRALDMTGAALETSYLRSLGRAMVLEAPEIPDAAPAGDGDTRT